MYTNYFRFHVIITYLQSVHYSLFIAMDLLIISCSVLLGGQPTSQLLQQGVVITTFVHCQRMCTQFPVHSTYCNNVSYLLLLEVHTTPSHIVLQDVHTSRWLTTIIEWTLILFLEVSAVLSKYSQTQNTITAVITFYYLHAQYLERNNNINLQEMLINIAKLLATLFPIAYTKKTTNIYVDAFYVGKSLIT